MTLLEIYNLVQTKEITETEAAAALELPLAQFRMRKTKWGHRLPLMFSVLDKVRDDGITRDGAAEALQVTVREINKLMTSWNVTRPIKPYLLQREASKVKWEVRKKFAIDFIHGSTTVDEAAESAEVDPRQMRRWVSGLLMKHFEMPWKDLVKMPLNRRRRLAQEIEDAEGFEMSKQNLVNSIARGDKTLQDEALERVTAKRMRLQKNVKPNRASGRPQAG